MRHLLLLLALASESRLRPLEQPLEQPARVVQVGQALSPAWEKLIAEVTNVCRSGQACNVSSAVASSCVKVTGGSNTTMSIPSGTSFDLAGTACGVAPVCGLNTSAGYVMTTCGNGIGLTSNQQFLNNCGASCPASGSFVSSASASPQYVCNGPGPCLFESSAATQSATVQGGPATAGSGATPGTVSGAANLTTLAGGAGGTTGAGGASGAIGCTTGVGGQAGSSTGNAASSGNWTGGTGAGGAGVLGGGAAASSGTASLTTGAGGAGTSAAAAAASGGITIQTGPGGAQNGGGGAASGALTLDTGAATGAATAGAVNICHTNCSAVNIGPATNGTINIGGGTATVSIGGGSTTGAWSATSNGALVVAATTYGAFSQAGNNVGAKFGEVACTHSTAGAGTAGTLAVFDSTGATLCSGSYTCTTTANTPTAIFNCNTAPIVGRAYGVRFTTGCGTTQVTGLNCSVEIVH